MEDFGLRAGPAAVLLLEVIALVWIGKKTVEILARIRFDREVAVKDNPAAGIALAGFYLALFTALSGLFTEKADTLAREALLTALHGAGAIAALLLSAGLWRPLVQVDFRKDILEGRNAGAALVAAAALIATGLVYRGAVHGQAENVALIAAFFAIGEGALLLCFLLYEWMTPYDVYDEIAGRSNLAAALGSAGMVLASGLVIGNAVEGEFLGWETSIRDAFLYMTPVLAMPLVRVFIAGGMFMGFGRLTREIVEDRNVAAGLVEGAAYVGIALFAVHLLA